MKDTFSALVVFSSSILLSIPNSQSYETREPLPQTGYWNYLPILGLWGRVAHHFLTDTDGIGTEVKILDKMFKEEYGTEEFVTLERDIVNKLPKSDVIYHFLEIMQNLQDIRDPITGKTLGDAFNIMINLQNDSKAVKEYTKRLNLVEPDHVTFYSSDTSDFNVLKVLKNAILQNPMVIIEILEDSQIDSTIANSVLTYLSSDKFLHGIDNMRTLLETFIVLYSDVLREENHPILAIKDPDTKMSLSEILKALLMVVSSEEFIQEIKTMVTSRELLDHLHENTKEIISTAIQQNKPYLMTSRNFIKKLKPFHIEVTEEDAEFLMEASKDGDLGVKAAQFLDQLKRVPDLDAKKISEIIADKGVKLSPDMIVNAMDSLVHYPPAMVSAILKDLGLSIPTPQLKVLVKTVKEIKEKYDAEDHDNFPTEKEDDESSLNDDNDEDVVSSSASELPKNDSTERVNNVTPLSYSV